MAAGDPLGDWLRGEPPPRKPTKKRYYRGDDKDRQGRYLLPKPTAAAVLERLNLGHRKRRLLATCAAGLLFLYATMNMVHHMLERSYPRVHATGAPTSPPGAPPPLTSALSAAVSAATGPPQMVQEEACCETMDHADLQGDDLNNMWIRQAADCCLECVLNAQCRGWTFKGGEIIAHRHCWLKGGQPKWKPQKIGTRPDWVPCTSTDNAWANKNICADPCRQLGHGRLAKRQQTMPYLSGRMAARLRQDAENRHPGGPNKAKHNHHRSSSPGHSVHNSVTQRLEQMQEKLDQVQQSKLQQQQGQQQQRTTASYSSTTTGVPTYVRAGILDLAMYYVCN